MLSRKEFFRQGVASLGRAILEARDAIRPAETRPPAAAAEDALPLQPGQEMVAAAYNQHCLARSCGCFTCLERCAAEAIQLVPGVGIRIDANLCTGCGSCELLCPVAPKAIRLRPRPEGGAATDSG